MARSQEGKLELNLGKYLSEEDYRRLRRAGQLVRVQGVLQQALRRVERQPGLVARLRRQAGQGN